ncbi:MAG: acetyl-CoA carboxylase biotin carboxylase subunit [Pseudomonadota bacterium]
MIESVLIANRGEIACRIARTARRLGLRTVAVFSDADRHAVHTRMADSAIHIGASPPKDSYLNAENVLAAAKRAGVDAIHPGYGFLSENAEFARVCSHQGIEFIGPPASAIESMGSKARAKAIMNDAGVPLIPGYHGESQSPSTLRDEAQRIGFPVLLKAAAGGGGKGMREVCSLEEFDDALESACREARASFGDDRMLVERRLVKPRHVEVQVFFDKLGNGVHLAERDCSIQRRHQKVLEEAPAPGLTHTLREEMGEAAISAARAIGYVGAGTIEFLLDEDGAFYFMEMNTRLQVEHPVTEMITGLDLVEWQFKVAAGEPLPLNQAEVAVKGHAMEVRIYAEDTTQDFLPSTGTIEYLQTPSESAHVRIDTGVEAGSHIAPFYDPMIAKLIVHGPDREAARCRIIEALAELAINGPADNIDFLKRVCASEAFRLANVDTSFISNYERELLPDSDAFKSLDLALACLALFRLREQKNTSEVPAAENPWSTLDGWRMNLPATEGLRIEYAGGQHSLQVTSASDKLLVNCDNASIEIGGQLRGDCLDYEINGERLSALLLVGRHAPHKLILRDRSFCFSESSVDLTTEKSAAGDEDFRAPMHGTVVAQLVKPGDNVQAGDGVIVLEAMKMEQTLRAPCAGLVKGFRAAPGQLIDRGVQLVDFEPEADL